MWWSKFFVVLFIALFANKFTTVTGNDNDGGEYCSEISANSSNALKSTYGVSPMSSWLGYSCFNFKNFPSNLNDSNYIKILDLGVGTAEGREIELEPEDDHNNNNSLETLPSGAVFHLPNLRRLYLAQCKIQKISNRAFTGAKSLTVLYLHDNLIKEIGLAIFSDLPNLEVLTLGGNPLNSFKDEEEFPPELENLLLLGLENCGLTSIPQNIFKNLQNLENLNLRHNQLTTLSINAVCPLTSLSGFGLGLGGNPWHCDCEFISTMYHLLRSKRYKFGFWKPDDESCNSFAANISIPKDVERLSFWEEVSKYDDILDYHLPSISNITQCGGKMWYSEQEIQKKGVMCKEVHWDNVEFLSLYFLNLHFGYQCRLSGATFPENFDFGRTEEVEYLWVRFSKEMRELQHLPLEKLPNLLILRVGYSENMIAIGNKSFQGGHSLMEINLMSTRINSLDLNAFRGMKNLQRLILGCSHEQFHFVGNNGEFPKLGLTYLDLSYCGLTSIDHKLLRNVDQLQKIRLDGNELKSLDSSIFFPMKNLSVLALGKNPWHCDCQLKPLLEFIKERNIKLKLFISDDRYSTLECRTAASNNNVARSNRSLVGVKLDKVDPDDLICPSPTTTITETNSSSKTNKGTTPAPLPADTVLFTVAVISFCFIIIALITTTMVCQIRAAMGRRAARRAAENPYQLFNEEFNNDSIMEEDGVANTTEEIRMTELVTAKN